MRTKILYTALLSMTLLFSSCLDDLDVKPLDPNIQTGDKTYNSQQAYLNGLMKIYSVYAMSGQDGEGSTDIQGMDAGNTQLLRSWWILQEVSTDEAICSWSSDSWSKEINELGWSAVKNESIEAVYLRCMYIVAVANDYLKQAEESTARGRGLDETAVQAVIGYRNEARFMRALAYYMLMDTFGRPPFITEQNHSTKPTQISRADLFNWIEGEIKEVLPALPASRSIYGRADQATANALLSRMYLNAEVYIGTPKYTECITASKAVISAGYTLTEKYKNLFVADNNVAAAGEIIFPICYDGAKTQTFGGTTFIICSSRAKAETNIATDGIKEGWDGIRARRSLIDKFEFSNPNYAQDQDAASILDKRGIFKATNRTLDIDNWAETFSTQGWAVYKYSNIKADGITQGSNIQFPDTDFPFFRLGEIYLNYAEAVKRGGQGGDPNMALQYVNNLRQRGYGNNSGNITAGQMTLDFLLDERSRELYWEGTRRTDLIRYGFFTSADYVWQFKGGVKNGTSVDSYKNLFPIPVSDMSSNPSLTQNEGYK